MRRKESVEVCPRRRANLCFCSLKAALLGDRPEPALYGGSNQMPSLGSRGAREEATVGSDGSVELCPTGLSADIIAAAD